MVDAVDGRQARRHAGGQHHLLEAAREQLLRVDPCVQPERDAGQVSIWRR
jgi:hypothetical protein